MYPKLPRDYDGNITLIKKVTAPVELEENQWYALMVTDRHRGGSDTRQFFDKNLGWIGLERPTRSKPYLSKDFEKRKDRLGRGDTFVVEVRNTAGHCILGE